MTRTTQLVFTLVVTLFALLATARAQTPRVSTVNITPEADRVRISATGEAIEMRVEVSDQTSVSKSTLKVKV